jgi:glutamyl-tRNA reductase
MQLLILGVQYQNAPVAIRERVAVSAEDLPMALQSLHAQPDIAEAVIVSTCNRTEIYCRAANMQALRRWLGAYFGVELSAWESYLSEHKSEAAVAHIMRVASGLDSMVLGEPQVLGQVKQAYAAALEVGTVGKQLSRLFQMAFKAAKSVRSQTAIGEHPTSLAYAAIKLSQRIFQDIKEKKVLLIGAGEMTELAAKYLENLQAKKLIFANRTPEKAKANAKAFNGEAICLSEVPTKLAEVDMVVSATASDLPLIGKGSVERAMRLRKQKTLVLIDLAVPRDIEPEIKGLDNVYLYDVDSLQGVVAANIETRVKATKQAMHIIQQQISEYLVWQEELEVVHAVRQYREYHENLRDEVLHKAHRAAAAGKPVAEILTELAHSLTNKLLHKPTVELKQSAKRDIQKS